MWPVERVTGVSVWCIQEEYFVIITSLNDKMELFDIIKLTGHANTLFYSMIDSYPLNKHIVWLSHYKNNIFNNQHNRQTTNNM